MEREAITPNVALIVHPVNRYMHQTFTLYVRTLEEFCAQIATIKRRIERHELN